VSYKKVLIIVEGTNRTITRPHFYLIERSELELDQLAVAAALK